MTSGIPMLCTVVATGHQESSKTTEVRPSIDDHPGGRVCWTLYRVRVRIGGQLLTELRLHESLRPFVELKLLLRYVGLASGLDGKYLA
jgi:hypothetical protein